MRPKATFDDLQAGVQRTEKAYLAKEDIKAGQYVSMTKVDMGRRNGKVRVASSRGTAWIVGVAVEDAKQGEPFWVCTNGPSKVLVAK